MLGSGGFGAVYAATDASGRPAVVKLLAAPPGDELRSLARVCHPAVVSALGGGSSPVPYLAMARAPGVPLSELHGADPTAALRWVTVLADALAACHQAGVVHSDVKPSNVLVDHASGRVTLVDFGMTGKQGGTFAYAAPEVLAGGPCTPASDVYGLGLVAWEILSGEPPWAELPLAQRLAMRSRSTPHPPPALPEGLAPLLDAMLDPDPAHRPSAEAVTDALEAVTGPALAPGPDDVARRALSARVPRPSVDAAIARWLVDGGALAVTGPAGSGRTHVARAVANELAARGQAFAAFAAGGGPWAPVRTALADPSLPGAPAELPAAADAHSRADAATEILLSRAEGPLVAVVDGWDELDLGSRAVITSLARANVAVLVTGASAPPWARVTAALEPLGADEVDALVTALLGAVDPVFLGWSRGLGGEPRRLVRAVTAAVAHGALSWRRRAWVADPDQLATVDVEAPTMPLDGLLPEAVVLAAVIARAHRLEPDEALRLAAADPVALEQLVERQLVRGTSQLSVSPAVASAALAAVPDRAALDRRLAAAWLREAPIPYERLGAVLIGAGDPELVARHGAAAITAWLELDVAEAARLADGLWACAPAASLVDARLEALIRSGRVHEARSEAIAWLDAHPERDPAAIPILLALARIEDQQSEDAAAALAWIGRANEALGDGAPTAKVRLALGAALFRAGRLTDAEQVTAPLAGPAPDDPRSVADWLSAKALLAQIVGQRLGPDAGLALLADVRDGAGDGTAERAMLDSARGRLLWHAGRARDAARALEAAAAWRRSLPLVERARLENNAALCWYAAGDVDRAVAGWERALLSFERLDAQLEVVRVLVNLCQGLRDLGRWAQAWQAGGRALDLARAHGARAFEAVALGNLGDCAMLQRRFAHALQLFDRAQALAEALGLGSELVELGRRRAELASMRRDPDAEALSVRALALAEQAGAASEAARCRALIAWARATDGDRAAFHALADQAEETLRALGATADLAVARLAIAEGHLALGAIDAAMAEVDAVRRYTDEFGRPPLAQWAERIASRLRRNPSADRQLEGQLEFLTRLAVGVALHTELDVVLGELAVAAVELVDAERALVLLMDQGEPRVVASHGSNVERPPSMSVVERALALGREVVVTDVEERADLRAAESVVALHLRAVYCLPLVVDGVALGALYLDSREQSASVLHGATALLRALAAHGSIALRNARLTEEIRAQADHVRELAHDLRNPLTGISLLASDVLATGALIGRSDAELVLDAASTALVLVERTLGDHAEEPIAFGLADAVRRWTGPFARQARAIGVTLAVDLEPSVVIVARPTDIRRVFDNLIGNALKYTPGGGTVRVRTIGEPDRVGIEVADTGPGVPVDAIPHLFESGFQAPGALPGSGLGLAIVHRLVTRHGGSVRVANRAGGGARFTVWLPRSERAERGMGSTELRTER